MSKSAIHAFTVSPSIIYSLIERQAGSAPKAIQELVQNAIDAGATSIAIDLSETRCVVRDDGHGFRSETDIREHFGVFGFDHNTDEHRSRTFAEFGVGRAQIMVFARCQWRSNTFAMDVDIRARGLDYTLQQSLDAHAGTEVTAEFYEALRPSELYAARTELEDLCRYSCVGIALNGKAINTDPRSARWTMETDDAWFRLNEGEQLRVYNQGVYVRALPRYSVGVAGVVVTKPGVRLTLNMARNDVITAKCPVWKRLRAVLAEHAGEATRSNERLTDDHRAYLAAQTAEPGQLSLFDKPLFTLSNGRNVALRTLSRYPIVTVAQRGDRVADHAYQTRQGIALTPATLARFGVESVTALLATLRERVDASGEPDWRRASYQRLLAAIRHVDRIEDAPFYAAGEYRTLPDAKLSANERAALTALREAATGIAHSVCRYHPSAASDMARAPVPRQLFAGVSPHAEAWTDGRSTIVIEQSQLRGAHRGLAEFTRLVLLLLHEQLHDASSAVGHVHGPEFHEAFHEIALHPDAGIGQLAIAAFQHYLRGVERGNAKLARDADVLAAAVPQLAANAARRTA